MGYKRRFEELLRKLVRNEAGESEIGEIFTVLRQDRSLKGSDLPDPDPKSMEEYEIREDFGDIWAKVESETTEPVPERKSVWQLPLVRVAAAIALLIVAGLAGSKIYESYSWMEYATHIGEIRTIELADGSSVVLNGNSILRVQRNLSTDQPRDVYLTGEANFQVAKAENPDARFVVHTRDLNVEVLGTRFNVNSREKETVVYLEEGSVKVAREDIDDIAEREIYMSPGEKVEFSTANQKMKLIEVESEVNEISWREGIFEFENLTLDKILKQITDPYDYRYQIEEEGLKGRTFTVRIPDNDLEFSISVLEKLTGTSITDRNGTLIVKEKAQIE